LIEDLTISHQGGWYSVISLHGGGSPEAMKREIWRNYPLTEKVALVEDLLDRGILDDGRRVSKQPGRCCPLGCEVPAPEAEVPDHSRFAKRELKALKAGTRPRRGCHTRYAYPA
jgi:4-hydroxybutyryl-CoA dehydratase/vinylacetyl-CoA-Delta-isomerase